MRETRSLRQGRMWGLGVTGKDAIGPSVTALTNISMFRECWGEDGYGSRNRGQCPVSKVQKWAQCLLRPERREAAAGWHGHWI